MPRDIGEEVRHEHAMKKVAWAQSKKLNMRGFEKSVDFSLQHWRHKDMPMNRQQGAHKHTSQICTVVMKCWVLCCSPCDDSKVRCKPGPEEGTMQETLGEDLAGPGWIARPALGHCCCTGLASNDT